MISLTTPSEQYEFTDLAEAVAWAEPNELIVSVREGINKWGRTIWVDRKEEFEAMWDARRIASLEEDYWTGCQGVRTQRGCDAYCEEHLNPPRFIAKPKTITTNLVQHILSEAAE